MHSDHSECISADQSDSGVDGGSGDGGGCTPLDPNEGPERVDGESLFESDENLEDDLKRTWDALRSRTLQEKDSTDLTDIVEVLKQNSIQSGLSVEEAKSEAQVTAFTAC